MKSIKYIIVTALLLVAVSGFSQNTILGYEYWFDNNYSAKVSQTVTPEANFSLSTQISTAGLVPGIHTFNFRTWDNEGMYSVVLSSFFYKIPQTSNANKEIVVYEYWFDNDYANKTTIAVAPQTHFNLSELLDTENLVSGIHTLNIRFKDNSDLWSSTLSQFFYKLIIRETEIADNYITAYRYWFDSDFENAEYIQLAEPAKNFNLIENMNFTRIPKGEYEINFQFRDTLGLWSSVITDEIEKVAFPIADFSYELNATCENTTVTFTGNSFDNDTQSWNFGNGETSEEISPVSVYDTPGDYTVSLTVTDTETGNDSTITVVISIPDLRTTHSFSENVCDTYTAPDGQVYTESNPNITAIIPNAAGCDSIISIDLTVKHSTTHSFSETVCNSYTAPDGQVYTESGIKMATIPNSIGCDSIISINLTVNHSTTHSFSETVCDSYTAPDGQVYTESGIKTAIIPNAIGCDSIITINLTVNHSTSNAIVETACESYTAPDGQIYTESNPNITAIIPNAVGCDSIISIDLTVNKIDTTVIMNGNTLTANAFPAEYQWLDCDNDYSELQGETEQTFSPSINGNYAVRITQNGCTEVSNCYNVTVSSINNIEAGNINIYPNPTNGRLIIENGQSKIGEVIIYDMNGKKLSTFNFQLSTLEIDLSDYANGIYFIEVNKTTHKIIKK